MLADVKIAEREIDCLRSRELKGDEYDRLELRLVRSTGIRSRAVDPAERDCGARLSSWPSLS